MKGNELDGEIWTYGTLYASGFRSVHGGTYTENGGGEDRMEFPSRKDGESSEQWCDRLIAYTHILRKEIRDLKNVIRSMDEFRCAADRLSRMTRMSAEETERCYRDISDDDILRMAEKVMEEKNGEWDRFLTYDDWTLFGAEAMRRLMEGEE